MFYDHSSFDLQLRYRWLEVSVLKRVPSRVHTALLRAGRAELSSFLQVVHYFLTLMDDREYFCKFMSKINIFKEVLRHFLNKQF